MFRLERNLAIQLSPFFQHSVYKNIAKGITNDLELLRLVNVVRKCDNAPHDIQHCEGCLPSYAGYDRKVPIASLNHAFLLFSKVEKAGLESNCIDQGSKLLAPRVSPAESQGNYKERP